MGIVGAELKIHTLRLFDQFARVDSVGLLENKSVWSKGFNLAPADDCGGTASMTPNVWIDKLRQRDRKSMQTAAKMKEIVATRVRQQIEEGNYLPERAAITASCEQVAHELAARLL